MADSVNLSGPGSGIVSETTGAARSGHVTVESNAVSLTDEAVIQTGTLGNDGAGGDVTINAGSVDISGGSRISSRSAAENAGQVAITANTLTLDNVSIETSTTSDGQGGDVVLNVGSISLSNEAKINSSTSAAGRAGDITMNVGTLSLADGSEISSASIGKDAITNPDDGTIRAPGTAGNVVITASGSFTSDASTIATSSEANHGGDVSIIAHSVQLSNGTLITANSNAPLEVKETVLINGQLVEQVVGDGNAGNISVHSGSTFVMTNSSMTTEASRASGGQIKIITPEMVRVINGRVSTSVAGSATDTAGGNITIDPQFVVLQGGQIVAKAFAGSGGAIDIIAGSAFISDPASIVDASSTTGISGTINIQSPLQNVGGELAALSQEFSSAAALLAQQCAARAAGGTFSTFVVVAREGVPVEPGGFLASPSLTAEALGSRLSGRDSYRTVAAVTGAFPEYEARPIQLAKLGNACR
jgi:large exoprotein involved in heme utilization and adhesion